MTTMRIVMIMVMMASVLCCEGKRQRQKTTRPGLRTERQFGVVREVADTVYVTQGQILVSGFEKAQNSSTESMFVTNTTDYDINAIDFTIEYTDLNGKQLHRTTKTVKCDVPPHQTVAVEIRSWDRQHLWYYKHTQARHNEYCNPFDVRIHINYILVPSQK